MTEERGFTRVADVDEIREGRGHGVFVDGLRVAVFRRGGEFFAVADRCPHMGASLSEGRFARGVVQCHWHGWRFDVRTGRCEQKAWARLALYEVRVEGRDVLLRPRPPARSEPEPEEEDWVTWQPPADDEPGTS